jgi:hypothetical protein
MVTRTSWQKRIEDAWKRRPIVWLTGVRRAGKTFLSQSLPKVRLFDCELPRVRRLLEDPEAFLRDNVGHRIVLDEIHRLRNPSEILKIAADHYPGVRILATGSSSLGASRKSKDTLAGRKETVLLTPMNQADLADFGGGRLEDRLLKGGLPPFYLAPSPPERDFQEWMDAYWAKDIQELFRLERRSAFQKLLELVFVSSGGVFEANRYAGPCEVSRNTILNYLAALDETLVVHRIRPFTTRKSGEIVAAPKVYAFDTGFVCAYRGWDSLRPDDLGILWEHYVLNELVSELQTRRICTWRDKRGREVDFVLERRGRPPVAIECKWSASGFDPSGFAAFRSRYEKAACLVVAHDVDAPFTRTVSGVDVTFVGLDGLVESLG